jgi:tetratricopeptide (TPR) repeat protein
MEEKDAQPTQATGKVLNWILAMAIALVACASAWVGWNCIESAQKNAAKLHKFHVTADNTKFDSARFDGLKNKVDGRVFTEDMSPAENLQSVLVKQEGSELVFSKAVAALNQKQFSQAVPCLSQVLAMIPGEARRKSFWFACGETIDRRTYTARAYRNRAICYSNLGDNARAVADMTEAIKLEPNSALNYQKRAELHYLLGNKRLGDEDTNTMRALMKKYPRPAAGPTDF